MIFSGMTEGDVRLELARHPRCESCGSSRNAVATVQDTRMPTVAPTRRSGQIRSAGGWTPTGSAHLQGGCESLVHRVGASAYPLEKKLDGARPHPLTLLVDGGQREGGMRRDRHVVIADDRDIHTEVLNGMESPDGELVMPGEDRCRMFFGLQQVTDDIVGVQLPLLGSDDPRELRASGFLRDPEVGLQSTAVRGVTRR